MEWVHYFCSMLILHITDQTVCYVQIYSFCMRTETNVVLFLNVGKEGFDTLLLYGRYLYE